MCYGLVRPASGFLIPQLEDPEIGFGIDKEQGSWLGTKIANLAIWHPPDRQHCNAPKILRKKVKFEEVLQLATKARNQSFFVIFFFKLRVAGGRL